MLKFHYSSSPVLQPVPGCIWADQMVLNPAFIQDPESHRLHMLFRASGPWPQMQRPGEPLPYPIFLGYAYSDDGGEVWNADFSRPALAPRLAVTPEDLYITNAAGKKVLNHANGCIEDPRLFWLEGTLYLSCACRMFPPGPYWEGTPLDCCTPAWAKRGEHSFGLAATANVTVSVLYKVDLTKLASADYENAFTYVCPLTDPEKGDNRDVYLFPERLLIDGRKQYVCLHRPWTPRAYAEGVRLEHPSMFISAADCIEDLAGPKARQHVLAGRLFQWEADRIGGSFPPIRLEDGQWLISYHGKTEGKLGYTQSFMIIEERPQGFPIVRHRCPERLMYAHQPWELSGKFPTPCLFTCAGVVVGDELVMTYGAADTKAGVARVNFDDLVSHIRLFDAEGNRLDRPVARVGGGEALAARAV